ncbi:MAG: 16S rRNA (guanine(966)-N(2))-methyltransferase RsmD [Chitinophagales bacterium]|nr:16S rRNA (guanine(966)-N(2))-methyltransferase RsmD [Hyphomicrobiales bacterium]
MRIVSGRFRGKALAAPKSRDIRPTTDKTRESVFNILAHGIADFTLEGAHVLDLFAGSGAMGLEAISRGAATCLFIDTSAEARGLIRQTIENFGLEREAKLYRRDATSLGPAGNLGPFNLVFADPPYGKGLAELALASAAAGGWLAPGAIAVIEEEASATIALPPTFAAFDQRDYGGTSISFARFSPFSLTEA